MLSNIKTKYKTWYILTNLVHQGLIRVFMEAKQTWNAIIWLKFGGFSKLFNYGWKEVYEIYNIEFLAIFHFYRHQTLQPKRETTRVKYIWGQKTLCGLRLSQAKCCAV